MRNNRADCRSSRHGVTGRSQCVRRSMQIRSAIESSIVRPHQDMDTCRFRIAKRALMLRNAAGLPTLELRQSWARKAANGTYRVAAKHAHENEEEQSCLHKGSAVGGGEESEASEEHEDEGRDSELDAGTGHNAEPSGHLPACAPWSGSWCFTATPGYWASCRFPHNQIDELVCCHCHCAGQKQARGKQVECKAR
jgi:hypothetical protein